MFRKKICHSPTYLPADAIIALPIIAATRTEAGAAVPCGLGSCRLSLASTAAPTSEPGLERIEWQLGPPSRKSGGEPYPRAMASKTPSRSLESYTAQELRDIAERAEWRRAEGFLVPPGSVALYVEALKALARERARG